MFTRQKDGEAITYMANLSKDKVNFTSEKTGISVDYLSSEKMTFSKEETIILVPWEFKILID